MFTLVAALCATLRALWSFIRGETARDRKFGRPRTGLARARRGVAHDGAGWRTTARENVDVNNFHYFRSYFIFGNPSTVPLMLDM